MSCQKIATCLFQACLLLTLAGIALVDFLPVYASTSGIASQEDAPRVAQAVDDTIALLQGPVTLLSAKRDGAEQVAAPRRLTVPLRKQYVPISKNGTVIAYKTSYFGRIELGKKDRQPFSVVFDTGSGHVVLPSVDCPSDTCMKHRRYNRSASEGAVDIDHTGKPLSDANAVRDKLSITFGTGEVLGEFVRDHVCMGPRPEDCVEANIVIARKMTEEPFGLFEFDGILGLGATALALNPHFSLFNQMVGSMPTMQPLFAVLLARNDDGQSAISFGGHEENWAKSEVQWAPVAKQELGYWQVQLSAVRIGNEVLEDCLDGTCHAILDTGTSLLGVPRQASRGMQKMLARTVPAERGLDRSNVDCRTVPGSDIHFELAGGPVVTLTAEDYTRPKPLNMTTADNQEGWDLYCRSLLLPVDMKAPLGPKIFIWGEPVLRKYLTLYDWGKRQVGFATAGSIPLSESGDESSSAIGSPPADSLVAGVPLSSKPA